MQGLHWTVVVWFEWDGNVLCVFPLGMADNREKKISTSQLQPVYREIPGGRSGVVRCGSGICCSFRELSDLARVGYQISVSLLGPIN